MGTLIGILVAIAVAVTGYFLGAAQTFRRQKAEAYKEFLLPIIRAAYEDLPPDELTRLNEGAVLLWLWSSKEAAAAVDKVMEGLVKQSKQEAVNLTELAQRAIAAARKDMHPWPWRTWETIEPNDIAHFWFRTTTRDQQR